MVSVPESRMVRLRSFPANGASAVTSRVVVLTVDGPLAPVMVPTVVAGEGAAGRLAQVRPVSVQPAGPSATGWPSTDPALASVVVIVRSVALLITVPAGAAGSGKRTSLTTPVPPDARDVEVPEFVADEAEFT